MLLCPSGPQFVTCKLGLTVLVSFCKNEVRLSSPGLPSPGTVGAEEMFHLKTNKNKAHKYRCSPSCSCHLPLFGLVLSPSGMVVSLSSRGTVLALAAALPQPPSLPNLLQDRAHPSCVAAWLGLPFCSFAQPSPQASPRPFHPRPGLCSEDRESWFQTT